MVRGQGANRRGEPGQWLNQGQMGVYPQAGYPQAPQAGYQQSATVMQFQGGPAPPAFQAPAATPVMQPQGGHAPSPFQVQVPQGCCGGSQVRVMAPTGQEVDVTVPAGLMAGDVFEALL